MSKYPALSSARPKTLQTTALKPFIWVLSAELVKDSISVCLLQHREEKIVNFTFQLVE